MCFLDLLQDLRTKLRDERGNMSELAGLADDPSCDVRGEGCSATCEVQDGKGAIPDPPVPVSEMARFNEICQANRWGSDVAAIIVTPTADGFSARGHVHVHPVGISAASTCIHVKSSSARAEVAAILTEQFA